MSRGNDAIGAKARREAVYDTGQATSEDSKNERAFGRGNVGSQQGNVHAGRLKQKQNAQGAGNGGNRAKRT